ncbi:hypothetical protein LUZ60_000206 [Juncus effusus]|nr:hypothetical protein LUZ60_000206 [Juncus effusus]
MERDFLGINARKSEDDDEREPRENSAIYGNPTVGWPFANFSPAQQNLFPYTPQTDEKSSNFSQFRVPSSPVINSQKSVNLDGNNYLHGSQSSQKSVNLDGNNYLHGSQSSGSGVLPLSLNPSAFQAVPNMNRDAQNRPIFHADLTMFYAGKVMYFKNVPIDKAGEIVRLANSSTNPTTSPCSPSSSKITAQNPTVQNGILSPKMKHCQNKPDHHFALPPRPQPPSVSTEISLTTQSYAPANEGLTCGAQSEAPKPNAPPRLFPQAIPQARKASLSRFLEKRKERVSAATPYSSSKKSSENNLQGENNFPGKSSENYFPGKSSENHFTGKSSENFDQENNRNREESTRLRI